MNLYKREKIKLLKIIIILGLSGTLSFCVSSQKKIQQEKENDPQYNYEKAVVAWNYGLPERALEFLNQAISLDKTHFKSYRLLGLIHFKKGNLEEALSAYQKALEINPESSKLHCDLGIVYEKMGNLNKAEEHFRKAYSLDQNPEASFNLAKIYFQNEKLEEALNYVQSSIQEDIRSASAYNLQGVILNKLGRYPQAIQSFKNALRFEPQNYFFKLNLGIAYFNNEQYGKAEHLFKKLLSQIKEPQLKQRVSKYLEMLKERQ